MNRGKLLNEPSASHKNAFMLNCCSRLALLSMFHLLLGHSRKAHSHWMKTKNMCTIAFNVGTCYTSSSSPIEPFPMLVFSFFFFFFLWHRFNGGVCLIGNFELFSPFFSYFGLFFFRGDVFKRGDHSTSKPYFVVALIFA